MCQRLSTPRPRKGTVSSAGGVAGGRAAGEALRPRRPRHLCGAWRPAGRNLQGDNQRTIEVGTRVEAAAVAAVDIMVMAAAAALRM